MAPVDPVHPPVTGSPLPLRQGWAANAGFWQCLVGAAAVALYARAVGFGWVFDDPLEIVGNEFVRSLAYLPKWFTTTAWAGSGMETYLYRPLPLATYALNYQLTGLEPWSYHLVNVLLHAGVSLLVFRLGFLWGLPVAATGMGALLFAVHPAHVEVVAAVFGRKDLLAALFVLLMALGHRWALQSGGWRRALPVASFALALLSKEVGAAGLPLVAAQDLLLGDRRRTLAGNRAPSLYIAYLGVLLLYVLARNRVTGTAGVPDTSPFDNPLVGVSVAIRLATALVVIGKGILLQAAPLTLSPDYSYNAIPLVESLLDVRLLAALSALGVGGALLAPALLRRRRRAATGAERPAPELLAIAWYGIALLPASNLLVPVGTIFGERLLYLPGVAFFLVVGVGLHRAAHRLPRAIPAGAALLVVALGAQTVRYSSAWSDDVSLFRWAVANVPASTKVHHKLGEELLRRGDLGGAIRSLDRALEIAPANEFAALTRSMAASRIAERYLPPAAGRGGADEAARDPDVLYVLGQISRERGEAGRAVGFWEEALRLDPGHPESLADLAIVRVLAGDTVTAADYLESAVRRRPSLTTAWLNLAQLRLARGETPLAREALRRFLETAGSHFPEQTRWARATLEGLTGR